MIIHIVTDEKFINAAYSIYNRAFPQGNIFCIIRSFDLKVNHINLNDDFIILNRHGDYSEEIRNLIDGDSIIVFHGMSSEHAKISNSFCYNKQIWSVFGKEFYENPYIYKDVLLGPKTSQSIVGLKYSIKQKLRKIYFRFFKNKTDHFKLIKTAFGNINSIAILYEEEFEIFKKTGVFSPNVSLIKFSYYPLDIVIGSEKRVQKYNNILIGNSATISNNHLEVLDILSKVNIGDSKIYIPLSYGDENYRKFILDRIDRYDLRNVVSLTTFLDLKDYQDILKTCTIVIMNHFRQQAVGNVLNSMFLGAKVFLSNKNSLYHFLKRIGCIVYSIEDDISIGDDFITPLTEEDCNINRSILEQKLSQFTLNTELIEGIKRLSNVK